MARKIDSPQKSGKVNASYSVHCTLYKKFEEIRLYHLNQV